jgi:hypothetical protein
MSGRTALTALLDDNDAMDVLIHLFIDGMSSGGVSAVVSLAKDADLDLPLPSIVRYVSAMCQAAHDNPLAVEGLRDAVRARVTGILPTAVIDLGTVTERPTGDDR